MPPTALSSTSTRDLTSVRNVRIEDEVSDDFVESIRKHGILKPLEIYLEDNAWTIFDGKRRLMAAIKLRISHVPCMVIDPPKNDVDDLVRQVVINTTQKPLNCMDVALACKALQGVGQSQKQIGEQLNMSVPEVSLAISTADASPALQKALVDGKLAPSAVEALLPLPLDVQTELMPAAIKARTTRAINELVRTEKSKRGLTGRKARQAEGDFDPMEEMALVALEEAQRNLEVAIGTPIKDETLRNSGRRTVKSLLQMAQRLDTSLR